MMSVSWSYYRIEESERERRGECVRLRVRVGGGYMRRRVKVHINYVFQALAGFSVTCCAS